MIGIVICCHGKMGDGVRDAAEMIVGTQEQLEVIGVNPGDGSADLRAALEKAVEKTDDGHGVLLLTDLFGGTPTNICCTLLGLRDVEVITGFNLPLLIKALTGRTNAESVSQLAKTSSEYGQRHISVAGELLAGELLQKGKKSS